MAKDTSDSEQAGPNGFSRRKWMELVATGSAMSLAGCSGNGNDTDTQPEGGDGGDGGSGGDGGGNGQTTSASQATGPAVDDTYSTSLSNPSTKDLQYNQWNAQGKGTVLKPLYFDFLAGPVVGQSKSKFVPMVASDWSVGDGKMTLQINENHTWHNGDPITGKDLATQFKLAKAIGKSVGSFYKEVNATGEKSFEFVFDGSVNSGLFKTALFSGTFGARTVHSPEWRYGKYVQRLEDASSEDAKNKVVADLTQKTIKDTDHGSGLWDIESQSGTRALFTKYEDYANQYITADDVNFSNYEVIYTGSRNKTAQAALSDKLDGGRMNGRKKLYQPLLEDDKWKTVSAPSHGGVAIGFNNQDPVYGNRKVKQAIAYALNRKAINDTASVLPKSKKHVKWVNGLSTSLSNQYVDDTSILRTYDGKKSNTEKAAKLMREAGFEKKNGKWKGSIEGKTLKADVPCPTFWTNLGKTAVSQLQEFGIPVTLVTQEPTTFFGKNFTPGNFRIGMALWGQAEHPYLSYSSETQALTAHSGGIQYPKEVTIPWPPGSSDGSTKTINVDEKVSQMSTASNEEVKQLTKELAWLWTVDIPSLPVQHYRRLWWYSTDDWKYPSPDSDQVHVRTPYIWPFSTGAADAKTK